MDSKAYTGSIRVRDVGGFFRRDERLFLAGRDRSHLADGMKWQIAAVEHALADAAYSNVSIVPVLCFVKADWPLFGAPREFRGVRLESLRSLRKLASRVGSLSSLQVDHVAEVLSARLRAR